MAQRGLLPGGMGGGGGCVCGAGAHCSDSPPPASTSSRALPPALAPPAPPCKLPCTNVPHKSVLGVENAPTFRGLASCASGLQLQGPLNVSHGCKAQRHCKTAHSGLPGYSKKALRAWPLLHATPEIATSARKWLSDLTVIVLARSQNRRARGRRTRILLEPKRGAAGRPCSTPPLVGPFSNPVGPGAQTPGHTVMRTAA